MDRVAAITIDVDALRFYLAIHGLEAPRPEDDPIFTVALPRFFELLEEAEVPATLFVVGEDAGVHLDAFLPMRKLGCEIASHSFRHDYRLFERSRAVIEDELMRAEKALLPLCPSGRVVGFRAPGYNTSPALLEALVARGYLYDSSLLPALPYWAARAAAIGRYRLAGRRSASRVGEWRAFAGPLEPYRTEPSRPWRPAPGGRLVELPMAAVPGLRVPLIGTSWALLPEGARGPLLNASLRKLTCFNFEMHAIDLLDASDPGIPAALAGAQPDLRVPVREKRRSFARLFARLRDSRSVLPLREIAAPLAGRPARTTAQVVG